MHKASTPIELPFKPSDGPMRDFLVTTQPAGPIHGRMTALGAEASRGVGYTLYTWDMPEFRSIFLGAGVLGHKMAIGPKELESDDAPIEVGTCCKIVKHADSLSITPDPQGLCALYAGEDFITNRLHLAALCSRAVDITAAISTFFNNGRIIWDQAATPATPVEGVSLVPCGTEVRIVDGTIRNESTTIIGREALEPDQYWELISQAATEICSNVEAILDAGVPVLCDITGGLDSRMLLGALASLGRVDDVSFNTNLTPNETGEMDLTIGSGLVKEFGGTYEFHNPVCGFTEIGLEEAWTIRRSKLFGGYHFVPRTFPAPGAVIREKTSITMGGACGESYRNAFPSFLSTRHKDVIADEPLVDRIFRKHLWKGIPAEFSDLVVADMTSSFLDLDGSTCQEKLNSHHYAFRSRFHFSNKMLIARAPTVRMGPLFSRSLLQATRGLPTEERNTGRAIFDVTKTLCEKLPYFPYVKSPEADYSRSRYHRQSEYDHQVLDLPNGRDLLEARGRRPQAAPEARTEQTRAFQDAENAFFDGVLASTTGFLRRRSDWPAFLGGEEMSLLVDRSANANRVQRLRMASKLQQVVDLLAICEAS